MSHCIACDRLLSDEEAKRKHSITKEEIGLCDICLGSVEEVVHIPVEDPDDVSYNDSGVDELDGILKNFDDGYDMGEDEE